MNNRMYMVYASKYKTSENSILNVGLFDNLDEALKFGKNTIRNYCYNTIFKYLPIKDSELPIDVTDDQLDNFIDIESFTYFITISVVSCNRKRFNTSKELMEYFNNNINNISNDNLYDFLLSLVEYHNKVYDYTGKFLWSSIIEQTFLNEKIYDSNIDFDEEKCKTQQYKFEYKTRD